jgi:Carboxypeptidase regulatory-like domain
MNRPISNLKVVGLTFALLSLLTLITGVAFGQTETGSISGTVTDPSGAIVPGAKIVATNTATNQTRTETVSGVGQYTITNLQPGSYVVSVTATGFSESRQSVDVVVGSRATLDVHLIVGTTGTVVEVRGATAGAQVDEQSPTIGETITPTQIMSLPSLTRNAYDFVLTAGNVSTGDAGGRGVMASINGQRSSSTEVLLDGAENVDLYNAAVGQQVPLDSVQEFTIATSNYTAEFGRASGGVVNVATKSGTNQFHGSLYAYNRVSDLASQSYQTDADNWAQAAQGLPALPNSSFVRNQFGYSIGGPIWRDKLFFFSNTEWTRVRSSENESTYVFTPEFIAQTGAATQSFFSAYGALASNATPISTPITAGQLGTGSGVSGWTNIIPDASTGNIGSPNFVALATANPSLPVLQLVNFPVPTDAGAGSPQNTYDTVNRVDFNITNKTTLWGRYALYNEIDSAGVVADSPYNGYNTGQNIHNQNILINLTHIFTPSIVNQAKVSFNRLNLVQPLGSQPVSPSLYLAASVPTPNSESVLLPGYIPQSQGNSIPFGGPQNVYQYSDQVTITKGKHSFSIGGEFLQLRDNRVFGAYEEGIADLGRSSGQSLDAMLAGTIYSYQVAIDPNNTYPCQTDITTDLPINPAGCTINLPVSQPRFGRNNLFNDGSVYGMDNWKITKRLNLSLGLRWEYYGVQHNSDPALDSNFYYSGILTPASVRAGVVSPTPSSPIGELWQPSKKDFAPRIGFAYDLFGDGKTSIRGGYGISYERNFGNVTFNVIQNPPNYAVVSLASPAGFTLPTDNLGPFAGTGTKQLPAVTLRGVDPNIKTAYANMYSLAIERELIRNTVFALEYSGSRGIHQYSITNVNRYFGGPTYNNDTDPNPPIVTDYQATRTNTQYGNINFRGSNGDSWYDALNVRLQSTNFQSKGLLFTFNYTWAHSQDDLSSTFSDTNSGGAQASLGFLDWEHPMFDKGDSDYDVRNRVAFSAVYSPTYLKFENKFVQGAVGGWSIAPIWTWHSGTPFTMYDCGFAYGICARQLDGYQGNYSSIAPVDPINSPNTFTYFNPAAYTPYTATANGQLVGGGVADDPSCVNGACAFPANMARRNIFRVPNAYTLNLGVYKTFKLSERFALQLRGEAYNLFNHSNYYLNYGGTDSEFGSPVTIEKGFNPSSGNDESFERRNLQFALRLEF